MWHTISHFLLAPSKYRRTTLGVMSLAAFTLLGIEQVQAQSGLAPADQAAFDNLVVGKYTENAAGRLTFLSPGRHRETSNEGSFDGNYRYVNTGPNTGTLTITYDVTGNNVNRERDVVELTFTSATTGTFVSTYTEVGVTTVTERGSFELIVPFAPADQAAFDNLVVGKYIENAAGRLTFLSPGRHRETSNEGSFGGDYRYVNTGPNTGTLTYTYDATGNNVNQERTVVELTFTSATTGTFVLTYTEVGVTTVTERGSFELIALASDLVVQSPAVNDNTLTPGQSFTLSATVRNSGTETAASTTLHYYRSTDGTISTADTQIGTDSVVGLGVSGTSAESINLTAPATAGTYYYGACVASVTGEVNTGNNCSAAVRVIVTASDLVVQSPTVNDNTLTPGQSFTLSATVRNSGTETAASTTLRYYRSTDGTISTADTEIGTDTISSLATSASSSEQSINLTAPATTGTYYYGACVDSVTGESNTGNNCSAAVRVIVTASDLVVQSPTVNDNTLTPGQSFTLSATVRNSGTETAASTTLHYYRSTDGTISTADTQIGTDSVVGLGVSGTSAESINLTAPATAGTYYYGACVASVTGEVNTGNNCSAAVRVLVISTNINGDSTIDSDDALVLFYAYSLNRSQVMESNLLSEALRNGMTANQVLDNANLWKNRGREMGGDLNGDGEINQQDALIMFYAYQFRTLLESSATLRRLLFNGLRGEPRQGQSQMLDTDATYRELLKRALRLQSITP